MRSKKEILMCIRIWYCSYNWQKHGFCYVADRLWDVKHLLTNDEMKVWHKIATTELRKRKRFYDWDNSPTKNNTMYWWPQGETKKRLKWIDGMIKRC